MKMPNHHAAGYLILRLSLFSAFFWASVPAQGQTTNFNWIATSDVYTNSVAWDEGGGLAPGRIPNGGTSDHTFVTNGTVNYHAGSPPESLANFGSR